MDNFQVNTYIPQILVEHTQDLSICICIWAVVKNLLILAGPCIFADKKTQDESVPKVLLLFENMIYDASLWNNIL